MIREKEHHQIDAWRTFYTYEFDTSVKLEKINDHLTAVTENRVKAEDIIEQLKSQFEFYLRQKMGLPLCDENTVFDTSNR